VQRDIIADRAIACRVVPTRPDVAVDPRTPCIIGVARRTWRDRSAPEPIDQWRTSPRAAADDAGCPSALTALDTLRVVFCQSWQYDDPATRLAERLGCPAGGRAVLGTRRIRPPAAGGRTPPPTWPGAGPD